jgi:hypothetical protein
VPIGSPVVSSKFWFSITVGKKPNIEKSYFKKKWVSKSLSLISNVRVIREGMEFIVCPVWYKFHLKIYCLVKYTEDEVKARTAVLRLGRR